MSKKESNSEKIIRVAMCQLDTTLGNFSGNVDRICAFVEKAAQEKAELVVFPELVLSSYPPLDLLDRPEFLQSNAQALASLEKKLQAIPNLPESIVLGSITENPKTSGRAVCNSAVYFKNGKKTAVQSKKLLPTYDIFDEARYFEPGTETNLVQCPWGTLGLSVCEDAWFGEQHGGRQLYSADPAEGLKAADLVVNVSASPFEWNKHARRRDQVSGFVKRIGAPLIYVNQVGANDEILFDGGSLVFSQQGEVLCELPYFQECLSVVEVPLSSQSTQNLAQKQWVFDGSWKPASAEVVPKTKNAVKEYDIALLHSGLVTGIRDYFRKTGNQTAVLGLSGGIDSAVVACLAAEALGPSNVLGVSIPSQYSSSHSLADAESLAVAVGMPYKVLSLKFMFTAVLMELKPAFGGLPPDSTEENVQARLRQVLLMALANKRKSLLLTTGNKSELAVGYCTIYGDMAGALAPLGDVYKMRVYELARYINSRKKWIPESTLTKPPSAELSPGQTDEASLGPYTELDRFLELYLEGMRSPKQLQEEGFEPAYVAKILRLFYNSEFKRRQAAPVLKVTSKAFGIGRRIPIAKS